MDVSLRFEPVADHVLTVATTTSPIGDAEWEALLATVREVIETHGRASLLVHAIGQGGPDVTQRASLSDLASELGTIHMAVITDSAFIRGIVTALRWMESVEVRAFSPSDESSAVHFLQLERGLGVRALASLHALADRCAQAS